MCEQNWSQFTHFQRHSPLEHSTRYSGVARSLPMGGRVRAERENAGVRKIFGGHAFQTLGKRGKRPFQSYFAS